jgi:hypothetical protein
MEGAPRGVPMGVGASEKALQEKVHGAGNVLCLAV